MGRVLYQRSSGGFSILEVLIGVGIVSVLGMQIATMANSSRMLETDVKQMVNLQLIKKNIDIFTSNLVACNKTLGGLGADKKFHDIQIYKSGDSVYLSSATKRDGWLVDRVAGKVDDPYNGTTVANIRVRLTRPTPGKLEADQEKVIDVFTRVVVSAGTVTSCAGPGATFLGGCLDYFKNGVFVATTNCWGAVKVDPGQPGQCPADANKQVLSFAEDLISEGEKGTLGEDIHGGCGGGPNPSNCHANTFVCIRK